MKALSVCQPWAGLPKGAIAYRGLMGLFEVPGVNS